MEINYLGILKKEMEAFHDFGEKLLSPNQHDSPEVPENCFFLAKGKLFRLDANNEKVAMISSLNAQDERNLLFFPNINFDLTYLFELQTNFFQSVVDVYNQVYQNCCAYLDAKVANPPPSKFPK